MEAKKLNKLLVDQYVAAGSQGASQEALFALAGHFCDKIRARVGANPAAPPAVLIRLSKDSCRDVRIAVAGNPASPWVVQNQLVRDGDPLMRYELACDIDLPQWMLVKLSADKISWVRHEALNTLAFVLPDKYGDDSGPAHMTGRPCIDICNPWWRKTILHHL